MVFVSEKIMENDENLKPDRGGWSRIIILAVIVSLALGSALWFWRGSTDSVKDNQAENGNSNTRVVTESIKTSTLSNGLPETNSQLELIGDKLSEVLFDLREQQIEAANQTLAEAEQLALKSNDDTQLQQNLLGGIKQIRADIQNGKTAEAEQKVNLLLNQLDMPEN